jgi:3-hydroxybutyryl-CoA dehydrogenase
MDLTALDVSHPVMESIYHQYYEEPRYRPSVITAQRLAGGVLGKKVGEGFYRYRGRPAQVPAEPPVPQVAELPPVWVPPKAAGAPSSTSCSRTWAPASKPARAASERADSGGPAGPGRDHRGRRGAAGPTRTVGIDMMLEDAATKRRVLATNPATRPDMRDAAHALFARDGKAVSVIRDSGGFVTQRVVATIVNIAADMCQQGICSPQDLETAVTLGLGYPHGAAGHGRPRRPHQRAGNPVQPADGLRRPALPPLALAAPPRRPGPEPDARRGLSHEPPASKATAMAPPWC